MDAVGRQNSGAGHRFAMALTAFAVSLLAACGHRDPPAAKSDSAVPVAAGDLLPVGATAPDFSIVAHDGQPVQLSRLTGRYVVLYFYPHDDTPGCTKEACDFRDAWDNLTKAGVAVFGVSTQDA